MPKSKAFYQNVYLYLAIAVVIVIVGFYNSYFTKLSDMSMPYHIHGVSASLWITLMVLQPLLYRWGKMKIHQILGWFSAILVVLILVGGINMIQLMLRGQDRYPPNIVYNLAFIDVVTLIGFFTFYMLAVINRKNIKLHARYMVCTIFGPLIPALTRVFFTLGWANNFHPALNYSYLTTEIVLLLIIGLERKQKEIRFTYVPLFIFMVIQHILISYPDNWSWWKNLMNQFAGIM